MALYQVDQFITAMAHGDRNWQNSNSKRGEELRMSMHEFYQAYGFDTSYDAYLNGALEQEQDYWDNRAVIDQSSSAIGNLQIGSVNSAQEKEADAFADRVAGNRGAQLSGSRAKSTRTALPSGFEADLRSTKGKGTPLSSEARNKMEGVAGQDLSHIRVHDDQQAGNMARSIHAKAFSHGSDIYGKAENLDEHTLAHEVGHASKKQRGFAEGLIQRKTDPEAYADDFFNGVGSGYTWRSLATLLGSDGSKKGDVLAYEILTFIVEYDELSPQEIWTQIQEDPTQLRGYQVYVMSTSEDNALTGYQRTSTQVQTANNLDADLTDYSAGTVDYIARKHFIFGKKKKEEKRAEASRRATEKMQEAAQRIEDAIQQANDYKKALEEDLSLYTADLNNDLIADAQAKEQQTFDCIADIKSNALAAKDRILRYYYGSNTVIDNNTQDRKDHLDAYVTEIKAKLLQMSKDQNDDINALYEQFQADVKSFAEGLDAEAVTIGQTRINEHRDANYTSHYFEEDIINAVGETTNNVRGEIYNKASEVNVASMGWEGDEEGEATGAYKSSVDNINGYNQAIAGIDRIHQATNAMLDSKASANKAIARSKRTTYENMIDVLTQLTIESQMNALDAYYAKLDQFGITKEAALQNLYNNSITRLEESTAEMTSQSRQKLDDFKQTQSGQKTPRKKKFEQDLLDLEAGMAPLVSQLNTDIESAQVQNDEALNALVAEMNKEFKAMSESGTASISKVHGTSLEQIEALKQEGIEEQLQHRRDHLNNIIRAVRDKKTKMDQYVTDLAEEYATELERLEVDLEQRLENFKKEAQAILDGLDQKITDAEEVVEEENTKNRQKANKLAYTLKDCLYDHYYEKEEKALNAIREYEHRPQVLIYARLKYKDITEGHLLEQDFEDYCSTSQFQEAYQILLPAIPIYDRLKLQKEYFLGMNVSENEAKMLEILEYAHKYDKPSIERARKADDFDYMCAFLRNRLNAEEYFRARKYLLPLEVQDLEQVEGLQATPQSEMLQEYADELLEAAIYTIKNSTSWYNDDEDTIYNLILDLPTPERRKLWKDHYSKFYFIDGYRYADESNYATGTWEPPKGTEIHSIWLMCMHSKAEMYNERMYLATDGWGTNDDAVELVVDKVEIDNSKELKMKAAIELHRESGYTFLDDETYFAYLNELDQYGDIYGTLLSRDPKELAHDSDKDYTFLEMMRGDLDFSAEYKPYMEQMGVSELDIAKEMIDESVDGFWAPIAPDYDMMHDAIAYVKDPETRKQLMEDSEVWATLKVWYEIDYDTDDVEGYMNQDGPIKTGDDELDKIMTYARGDGYEMALYRLGEEYDAMNVDEIAIMQILVEMTDDDRDKLASHNPPIWQKIKDYYAGTDDLKIFNAIVSDDVLPFTECIDYAFNFDSAEEELVELLFSRLDDDTRFTYRMGYYLIKSQETLPIDFATAQEQSAAVTAYANLQYKMLLAFGTDDYQKYHDMLMGEYTEKEAKSEVGRNMAAAIYKYRAKEKDAIRDSEGTMFFDSDDISQEAGFQMYGTYNEMMRDDQFSFNELQQMSGIHGHFIEKYQQYLSDVDFVVNLASTIAAIIVTVIISIVTFGAGAGPSAASLGAYLSAMWGPAMVGFVAGGITKVGVSEAFGGDHYDATREEGMKDFIAGGVEGFVAVMSAGVASYLMKSFLGLKGLSGPALQAALREIIVGSGKSTLGSFARGAVITGLEGFVDGVLSGIAMNVTMTAMDEETWRQGVWGALGQFGESAFEGLVLGGFVGGFAGGTIGGLSGAWQLSKFQKLRSRLQAFDGIEDADLDRLNGMQVARLDDVNTLLEQGKNQLARKNFEAIAEGMDFELANKMRTAMFGDEVAESFVSGIRNNFDDLSQTIGQQADNNAPNGSGTKSDPDADPISGSKKTTSGSSADNVAQEATEDVLEDLPLDNPTLLQAQIRSRAENIHSIRLRDEYIKAWENAIEALKEALRKLKDRFKNMIELEEVTWSISMNRPTAAQFNNGLGAIGYEPVPIFSFSYKKIKINFKKNIGGTPTMNVTGDKDGLLEAFDKVLVLGFQFYSFKAWKDVNQFLRKFGIEASEIANKYKPLYDQLFPEKLDGPFGKPMSRKDAEMYADIYFDIHPSSGRDREALIKGFMDGDLGISSKGHLIDPNNSDEIKHFATSGPKRSVTESSGGSVKNMDEFNLNVREQLISRAANQRESQRILNIYRNQFPELSHGDLLKKLKEDFPDDYKKYKAAMQGMREASNTIGETGAEYLIRNSPEFEGYNMIYGGPEAPSLAGDFDQIWVNPGPPKKYLIVEAKGGSSGLGSRNTPTGRAEQGSKPYAESIINEMKSNPKVNPEVKQALLDINPKNTQYLHVQAPIQSKGSGTMTTNSVTDLKISTFDY